MSKAAKLEAAVAVITMVAGAIDRGTAGTAEAAALRSTLGLLGVTGSAVRMRRKRERERERDAPVTQERVTSDGLKSSQPASLVTPVSPSALPLTDLQAAASKEGSAEPKQQMQSARVGAAHVTRGDAGSDATGAHAARETDDLDDDEPPPRDPAESELDATAAVLSGLGIAGVSHHDRSRVRRCMPLLRALAIERGCSPADVLVAAKARFYAECADKGKVLGNAVLLAQLELWAQPLPAPPEPKRLIPLAPAPIAPPPDWQEAAAEGLKQVRAVLGKGAAE